jgi:quinol monooxygenase YgiN
MTELPVRLTIQWTVPPNKERSMTQALDWLMAAARTEPGYLSSSMSTTLSDTVTIRYTEEWSSETLLREQFQTYRFKNLIALIEHATATPLVEFRLPISRRGFDYVKEVCAAQ